jgi:hypothetical protein
MMTTTADTDSPWKEAIERYFAFLMALFFPHMYAAIDWTRGYTFLDTELQQIKRDSALGKRVADKLVQVYLKNGDQAWILIHIEVQAQAEATFEYRMYIYHSRIFDHYQHEIVSLAILGDDNPRWRPDTYRHERWGCELTFRFPTVKLLDYRERWDELEQSHNPFATIVMAHLKAHETRQNPQQRGQWKFTLVRRLYELGYEREDILELFRMIDWLMELPAKEDALFHQELATYEEARKMTYVTSIERRGIEKGIQQGREEGMQQGMQQGREEMRLSLLDGIVLALELKYGADHPLFPRVLEALREQTDVERLKALQIAIRTTPTLDELWRGYASGMAAAG